MQPTFERAVLLRKTRLGESDVSALLLGENIGPLWARASYAARSKRRFPAGIEHFTVYEVELLPQSVKAASATLRLDAARPLRRYTLNRDLARYTLAARMTEITSQALPPGGQTADIDPAADFRRFFNLLLCGYATLENCDEDRAPLLSAWFIWRMLALLGYPLDPFRCNRSEVTFSEQEPAFWSPDHMGLYCRGAIPGDMACRPLSSAARSIARSMQDAVPTIAGHAVTLPSPGPDSAVAELAEVMEHYLRMVLPRPLKCDRMAMA